MLVSVIALLIGSNGQDGRILYSKLSSLGYKILAVSTNTAKFGSLTVPKPDLTEKGDAHAFLSHYQPNSIFHVAAVHGSSENQLSVINSAGSIMRACHVDITHNILSWLRFNPNTKFHVALSSQMYRASSLIGSVSEETQTNPQNFYGETKSEAWTYIREYREKYELKVSASILFNHASEYSREDFVFSQLATQFVEISKKYRNIISLQNPSATIDISSAYEICDAMIKIVTRFPSEDFVLASGKNITLSDIVLRIASRLGLTSEILNLDDFRRSEFLDPSTCIKANPYKAKKLLGWEAKISPEDILEEIILHKLRGVEN